MIELFLQYRLIIGGFAFGLFIGLLYAKYIDYTTTQRFEHLIPKLRTLEMEQTVRNEPA